MGCQLKKMQYLSKGLKMQALEAYRLDFYLHSIIYQLGDFGQGIYPLYLSFLNSDAGITILLLHRATGRIKLENLLKALSIMARM